MGGVAERIHAEDPDVEQTDTDTHKHITERRPGAQGVDLEDVLSSYWYSPTF